MELCTRCKRPLKSKKSIENGIGPVCKRKKGIADAELEKIQSVWMK
ncbi:DUF6011 domain-containing protein [Viridibacillus sp. NPDC093762]